MSKSNSFENDMLKLFFNGTAIADLAENDTSSPAATLYLSLHTADPGEGGSQNTNECNYTNYARVGITRSGAAWVVTNNQAALANDATFNVPGDATNLPQTASYVGVGTNATAGVAGYLMYSGPITDPIQIVNTSVQPKLLAGSNVTEE